MDPVAFPFLRPGESAESAGWAVLRADDSVRVVAPDGAVVVVPLAAPGTAPHSPSGEDAEPAGRRVLVLGGARSGKSSYAEGLLDAEPTVTYVATAFARPDDDEWVARVAAHRARRPPGWRTVETTDLTAVLRAPAPALLVDCVSLWLAAHLEREDLAAVTDQLVDAWSVCPATVIAVSSEVGSGVVPVSAAGRRYRDELGRLNARLAATADEVWLVTAGLPRRLR